MLASMGGADAPCETTLCVWGGQREGESLLSLKWAYAKARKQTVGQIHEEMLPKKKDSS